MAAGTAQHSTAQPLSQHSHCHSTVTAQLPSQSQHSHGTVTAQSRHESPEVEGVPLRQPVVAVRWCSHRRPFRPQHTPADTFDPDYFPDPGAMVAHLASKGVRLMVSAWPYTDKTGARASDLITAKGVAVRFPNGSLTPWPDAVCDEECYIYDPFSKPGRDFVWNMLDTGYVKCEICSFLILFLAWIRCRSPSGVTGTPRCWQPP